MKKIAFLFAGVAMASLALAQLSKYKDWAKSPEAYFLTAQEKQEWSAVKSDEEAEKFIAQYWARRDPNPATAQNEFKDAIMRRVAAANEQFKSRRYPKGSESPRGRVFVVLGAPNRASQSRAQERAGAPLGDAGLPTRPEGGTGFGESTPTTVTVTWTYDKDKFDPSWDIGELVARFTVDPARGTDEMPKAPAIERAIAIIADKTVVNPSGTVASPGAPPPPAVAASKPAIPPAATGPASAAPPPPPAPAALPAATRAALDALMKGAKEGSHPGFWAGAFHSVNGEGFYALELDAPAEKVAAAPLKFGGVVTGESGQEAATYWEDAVLTDMKTGSRATDKVYERSIVLPPGSYRGSFGLFSGEATPVVSASASFKIESKPSDLAVSPLILANTLTPLTKRPNPTDPFVFGMDKPIKVEPKASRLFAKEDSLWYFYTVWNPKLPEPAAAPAPAPATTPGAAAAATAPAAPEAPKPRIQARIGVLKDGQPAFAPMTGPAEMQMLAPGYYATGSEIPLQTFEPGYYTFTLTVRDLGAARDSAAFKGIDRKEDFVVLKPDGSMPEKAAPKPTPKPRTPAKKG